MDFISLLTTAKDAGFEMGTIISIGVIAWKLRSDVKKEVGKQVDKVVDAIKDHNTRLSNLENDVQGIKKNYKSLMTNNKSKED